VTTRGTPRWPAAVALGGAILGLLFGAYSTADYVDHLDRQIHDIHCSFIPGSEVAKGENPCKTALYSAYSSVMRDKVWGGVPISLFAVGAFSFFIAFTVYLLVAGDRAPRRAWRFLGIASLAPLAVSILMGVISSTKLGSFCKTCVGIYASSVVLAIGGIAGWVLEQRELRAGAKPKDVDEPRNVPPTVVEGEPAPRPLGAPWLFGAWLGALALFAMAPAFLYYRAVPSYSKYVGGCGTLATNEDPKNALLHVAVAGAKQPTVMVVDPLCPTCKAFHQRLVAEGFLEQLDITLVLFPLDSECNWNLTTALHPGACTVAKAVLCAEGRHLEALEWAYSDQEKLLEAAKSRDGSDAVLARVAQKWPGLEACIKDDKTRIRLDEMMRFAVKNHLPVSTPQLFLGDRKLCDEDIDIGLPYAMRKLAPSLVKK
jgi:uncharacterized membrane protein